MPLNFSDSSEYYCHYTQSVLGVFNVHKSFLLLQYNDIDWSHLPACVPRTHLSVWFDLLSDVQGHSELRCCTQVYRLMHAAHRPQRFSSFPFFALATDLSSLACTVLRCILEQWGTQIVVCKWSHKNFLIWGQPTIFLFWLHEVEGGRLPTWND